jgi:glycosyltransferase involved in cell wall biosynthesis
MKLVVVSHKVCWPSPESPTGYATDGGFPMHMRALAELFDSTAVVVPRVEKRGHGERPLTGPNLSIVPLELPFGEDFPRKVRLPWWALRNFPRIWQEVRRADALHVPIPSDIGFFGIVAALALRKPLFLRHCTNWFAQSTATRRFWRRLMVQLAGGRNVMLATGGAPEPPSRENPSIRWIFSTSLTERELSDLDQPRTRPPVARLITVGRQEKYKGTHTLLESMPQIIEALPRATLDVVGDGGALPELKALAHTLGIADRVTFHGAVSHATVLQLLREADVFCFPTASEGFPKVVLEALACGLPVVTTRVSVLPHLIGDTCGFLLDRATPDALCDAVRTCLADPVRYQTMSAKARARARELSLERWRDTIGDLLRAAWGPLHTRRPMPTPVYEEAHR